MNNDKQKQRSYNNLEQRIKNSFKSSILKFRNSMRQEIDAAKKDQEPSEIAKSSDRVKWTDKAMVIITAILAFYTLQLFRQATTQSQETIKMAESAYTQDSLALANRKTDSINNVAQKQFDSINNVASHRADSIRNVRDSATLTSTIRYADAAIRADSISENAMRENRDIAKLNRETIEDENRAFIIIDSLSFQKAGFDSSNFFIQVVFKNIGKTAAFEVQQAVSPMYGYSEDSIFDYASYLSKAVNVCPPVTLGAGRTYFQTKENLSFMNKRTMNLLYSGNYYIYIAVNVEYKDIYKRHFFTHFLSRVEFMGNGFGVYVCSKYNDAD